MVSYIFVGIYFYRLIENNSLKDIYVNLWQMIISIQYFIRYCTSIQENWYGNSFDWDIHVLIFLGLVKFGFLKLPKFMGNGLIKDIFCHTHLSFG